MLGTLCSMRGSLSWVSLCFWQMSDAFTGFLMSSEIPCENTVSHALSRVFSPPKCPVWRSLRYSVLGDVGINKWRSLWNWISVRLQLLVIWYTEIAPICFVSWGSGLSGSTLPNASAIELIFTLMYSYWICYLTSLKSSLWSFELPVQFTSAKSSLVVCDLFKLELVHHTHRRIPLLTVLSHVWIVLLNRSASSGYADHRSTFL